jgi:hypothetical protein
MPQTWAVDDLLKAVVEYLYVAPAKVAEFGKRFRAAEAAASNSSPAITGSS